MTEERIVFAVTRLAAEVRDGVPVWWQGREIPSGPLTIELDEDAGSQGILDYSRGRAEATFHVELAFPELAGTLEALGADSSWTRPIRAVLRSEGSILEDHSFALSGRCQLQPHEMLDENTGAAVLPGH